MVGTSSGSCVGGNASDFQGFGVPVQLGQIEQAGGRGNGIVHHVTFEQSEEHILLDADEARGPGEHLRLFAPQPDQFGER